MKIIQTGKNKNFSVPCIAVGCMRIADMVEKQLKSHISECLDSGLNFFDHADIYGGGLCEINFGKAVKEMGLNREELIIQSKCGIVPGKMYDFSKEYIIGAVDGILKRLQTILIYCFFTVLTLYVNRRRSLRHLMSCTMPEKSDILVYQIIVRCR